MRAVIVFALAIVVALGLSGAPIIDMSGVAYAKAAEKEASASDQDSDDSASEKASADEGAKVSKKASDSDEQESDEKGSGGEDAVTDDSDEVDPEEEASPVLGAEDASVDELIEQIKDLEVDPGNYYYTNFDKGADPESFEPRSADEIAEIRSHVFELHDAFEALDEEEQERISAMSGATNSDQPLGRVLEVAYWTALSFDAPDSSTTLPNGTYDASSVPALSSEYSKGQSTSSRDKPWSVKSVSVVDGNAFATITVESASYTGILIYGQYYPRTNEKGNCEFADVPIDLNSTFYFSGISTSMPVPIAFKLTTSIEEEPEVVETPIDRARRLIAAIPTDCYDIGEDLADQITQAGSAYDALTEDEQGQLDEEYYVGSLTYGRLLEEAQWRIASFDEVDDSTSLADGAYTGQMTAVSDMGKSASLRQRNWTVKELVVENGKATALIQYGGTTDLGSLEMGGEVYDNVTTGKLSQFRIPVDLNGEMYFAVKARDAVDETAALMYHFVVSVDEENAQPDPEGQSDDGADSKGDSRESSQGDSQDSSKADGESGSGTSDGSDSPAADHGEGDGSAESASESGSPGIPLDAFRAEIERLVASEGLDHTMHYGLFLADSMLKQLQQAQADALLDASEQAGAGNASGDGSDTASANAANGASGTGSNASSGNNGEGKPSSSSGTTSTGTVMTRPTTPSTSTTKSATTATTSSTTGKSGTAATSTASKKANGKAESSTSKDGQSTVSAIEPTDGVDGDQPIPTGLFVGLLLALAAAFAVGSIAFLVQYRSAELSWQ